MLEHRLAKLIALVTFCMLIIGGTVNPTGSSLACPEPTMICKGSLFPAMTGGVFYEHGHRLWGTSLGILQIALTVLLLVRRKDLRRLPWLMLGMVIAQGLLGALTVYYKLPWYISTAHLLLGMTYFAITLWIVYLTRPTTGPLPEEANRHRERVARLGSARRWILAAGLVLLVQLVLGALVRHFEATLVCLDMPACNLGSWWTGGFEQGLHMIHRGFGVVTALVTVAAAIQVARAARGWGTLRFLMVAAPVIAAAQVALGVMTVLTLRQVPVAVGHFAGATLLWGTWVAAWIATGSGRRSLAGGTVSGLSGLRGTVLP